MNNQRNNHVLGAFVLLLLCTALVACGGSSDTRASQVAALTGDAANGATVWGAQCKACHGDDGKGTDLAGNDLTTDHAKGHSDESFIDSILNGHGSGMPAFGDKLKDQEVADVMAQLHKLQGK